ncbi:MAG: tetratricopeptide repeat protein, partial [Acidobacteriota bacterium]
LDHRPVRARRGTVLYRGVKFLHRYRVGLAAAAATFATLVASVFALLHQQGTLVEERNRALELQRRSATVTGYLVELFKLPDPSYSLGRQVTARELLDKSTQTIDRDLADQPQLLPELLSVLAQTYSGLGQLREARALVDRAIRLTRAQEDRGQLPSLLQLKAEVLSTEGDYPAARAALNEALVRMEGPRTREEELAYTYGLGYQGGIATWLGRFDEAERLLTAALAKAEGEGDPEVLAEVLEFNGHRLALAGDYAEASRFYARALDIRREQYGEATHPRILLLETAIAAVTVFNDPVDGENAFRQAIERHRTLFQGAHPILAIALNNLGRSLAKRGELAEAETYLSESLEMKRKIFSAQNPSIGITLGNIGDVKRQRGHFDEAEALFEEALDIFAQSVGREHADYGLVLGSLASVHIGTGDLDAARPLLEESLRIVSASTGDDTERALQIRTNLSAVEERQGRPEAARDYLRAAIESAGPDVRGSTTLTHAMLNLATLEAKLGDEQAAGDLYVEIVEREGDRSQVGLFAMTHAASWAFKQGRWLEAEHYADRAARGFSSKSVDEAWVLAAQRTRAKAILEQGRVDRAIELLAERLARVEARFAAGQTSQKQLDRARGDLAKAESRKMEVP